VVKHWSAGLTFSGGPAGADPEAVWAQLKPTLARGGWTIISDPAGRMKVARYQKDATTAGSVCGFSARTICAQISSK
jgi:hypothetical protein